MPHPALALYYIEQSTVVEYRFLDPRPSFTAGKPTFAATVVTGGPDFDTSFHDYTSLAVAQAYELGWNSLDLFAFGVVNGVSGIHWFQCPPSSTGNFWTYMGSVYDATGVGVYWVSAAWYLGAGGGELLALSMLFLKMLLNVATFGRSSNSWRCLSRCKSQLVDQGISVRWPVGQSNANRSI